MTEREAASEEVTQAGVLTTLRDLPGPARFVLLGVFVNQFGAFLQAFLVLYLVNRGFSKGDAGWALGAYGAGAVVGVLLGGSLADRLGPRLTIILAMLSSAVFTVTVGLLDSYPAILVVVALAGAMTQAQRPASATLLVGMTPPARLVMVMAMNRIALNLGTVGGPLVAAWLITVSWNSIFWVDGATALTYAVIAVFLLPRNATATAGEAAEADGAAAAEEAPAAPKRASYLTVLRDRPYLFFLFAMLTNALIHVQSMAVLPLAVEDAGYAVVVYSAVFAVGAGIVVTCELAVTKKVQYWPAARAAVIGLVLLGVGLVGYGVGLRTAVPVLLIAAAVGVVGQIIGGPTIFAWPGKVAPAGAEGRYQGLALGMFGLGQALGPVLGVTIYNGIGNNFWWFCGAGALLSAAAAGVGMRQRYLNQPTAVGELAEDEIEPAAGPALPIGGPEIDLDAVAHDKAEQLAHQPAAGPAAPATHDPGPDSPAVEPAGEPAPSTTVQSRQGS